VTSEKWQQIKEIFNSVLELPTNERREFAENCDESLREEVLALLKSHEESENFIEQSTIAVADFITNKPKSAFTELSKKLGAEAWARFIWLNAPTASLNKKLL
jgi:hypothetical protein